MITYSKRNVNQITFLLTIVIFFFSLIVFSKIKENFFYHSPPNLHKKLSFERQKEIGEESIEIALKDFYGLRSKKEETEIVQEKGKENVKEEQEFNFFKSNPWRIEIPSLKINAPIAEGVELDVLRRMVGHFPQSAKGEGNICLAAHNRGYRCNFFEHIKKLQRGDLILYHTEEKIRKYEVILNTIIEDTDWTYLEETRDNRITLITCEANKRAYRRCIQAIEI